MIIKPKHTSTNHGNIHFYGQNVNKTVIQQALSMVELSPDDIMVIFEDDRKFFEEHFHEGDAVISHEDLLTKRGEKQDHWNIFEEVPPEKTQDAGVVAIAETLFHAKLQMDGGSHYHYAVQELFTAVMLHFVQYIRGSNTYQYWNNAALVDFIVSRTSDTLHEMLESYYDMHALLVYAKESDNVLTQQVFCELRQAAREIFIGNFTQKGSLGIRNLIRDRGGRKVFIETEGVQNPVYFLLREMADKEMENQKDEKGSIYILTA